MRLLRLNRHISSLPLGNSEVTTTAILNGFILFVNWELRSKSAYIWADKVLIMPLLGYSKWAALFRSEKDKYPDRIYTIPIKIDRAEMSLGYFVLEWLDSVCHKFCPLSCLPFIKKTFPPLNSSVYLSLIKSLNDYSNASPEGQAHFKLLSCKRAVNLVFIF